MQQDGSIGRVHCHALLQRNPKEILALKFVRSSFPMPLRSHVPNIAPSKTESGEALGLRQLKTEERILVAAAHLFARSGYNGVSTREIAAAARVSEITVYRYYSRKRDLYTAALAAEFGRVRLNGDLLSRMAKARDARTAVNCAYELITDTIQEQPQLLRLVQQSSLDMNDDVDLILRKHLGEIVEVLARYLEPWEVRGMLRCSDARTLVHTLMVLASSDETLRRLFGGDGEDVNQLFSAYSDFCIA